MTSPIQAALGEAWDQLPAALKAHYQGGKSVDAGYLDIHFPRWMAPYLWLLHKFGALVPRRGQEVQTQLRKRIGPKEHQYSRSMRFADGTEFRFDSRCVSSGEGRLTEYVNRLMGLEMKVRVDHNEILWEGVRFVVHLGRTTVGFPEWLVLGHTTIKERAVENDVFQMDFRVVHPLFGEVFRYGGRFRTLDSAPGG